MSIQSHLSPSAAVRLFLFVPFVVHGRMLVGVTNSNRDCPTQTAVVAALTNRNQAQSDQQNLDNNPSVSQRIMDPSVSLSVFGCHADPTTTTCACLLVGNRIENDQDTNTNETFRQTNNTGPIHDHDFALPMLSRQFQQHEVPVDKTPVLSCLLLFMSLFTVSAFFWA